MTTCGEKLIELLEAYGIEYVFGIPGAHTIELYRGLAGSDLLHIAARHEQGAGFMADGYARASGKPAACFTISGPGAFNLMTPLAQALQDSVPMLVISADNPTYTIGLGGGRLHEVSDLSQAMSFCTRWAHRVTRPDELPLVIARAFSIFKSSRPGPVHLSLPLDVITTCADHVVAAPWVLPSRCSPEPTVVQEIAELLNQSVSPVVALGGGATGAGRLVEELAVKLDAPVTLTQNGKGLLPSSHALLVKGSPTSDEIRNLYAEADYVLAIGTEFSETDYDFFFNGQFRLDSQRVIRIDNCLFQLAGNVPGRRSLLADSRLAVEALLPHIIERDRGGASRVRNINEKLLKGYLPQFEVFFDCLNSVLGDVILVGDSTKPAYMAASQYHPNGSRRFFSAATGFGTLGFALPAAIGAKLACPDTPVVALVGDGGIQFTLNELSVCIEHEIPIILIVWNNNSYDMIVEGFHDAGLEPIACTPPHPDFMKLAQAYGCGGIIANSPSELRTALAMARSMRVTVLIEINEAEFFNSCAF